MLIIPTDYDQDIWSYCQKIRAVSFVNPVNTIGVQGAGIARQIGAAYPSYLAKYKSLCARNALIPGGVMLHTLEARDLASHIAKEDAFASVRYVIDAATKQDWRFKSKAGYITNVAKTLADMIRKASDADDWHKIILVPALGCGNGGLDWSFVASEFEKYFGGSNTPMSEIHLFPHRP